MLVASATSRRLILSDFGLSRGVAQASVMQTVCGTPIYIAPEILGNMTVRQGYDKAVDLWSLGVMLYVMFEAPV